MREDPTKTWTPAELAGRVKTKQNAVRKELNRLLLPGPDGTPPPVQRTGRGVYACFLTQAELNLIESPPPVVHAIQVVWKTGAGRFAGGSPPGRAPAPTRAHARAAILDAGFGLVKSETEWVYHDGARAYSAVRWCGPHRVTLQAYPTTGTLMASIHATKDPIDGPGLAKLTTWLQATIQAEGYAWTDPKVATVEINRDFKRVRLAGREAVKFYLGRMAINGEHSLRMSQLEGALVQVYNKHETGAMRVEVRLQPRDLDLANLQSLVTSMFYGPPAAAYQPAPSDPGEGGAYS